MVMIVLLKQDKHIRWQYSRIMQDSGQPNQVLQEPSGGLTIDSDSALWIAFQSGQSILASHDDFDH